MNYINIGTVRIPLDAYAVGGTAILGIRESGKTYTAKGIAEQLLEYRVPIVVFDAIGVWRYIKVPNLAKVNGKGFKVVVAGGKEPDLPLTPENAAEIVRAAIKENIPLVIDLYDKNLSKADWRRIVQTCFRTLLYENAGLRHIFLEEAAEYAPQKVMDGQTYAEVEKVVRMGGNASLGITLINQRSQEVNKAVLDLCENIVLMRQRGPHAIDALQKWTDKLDPDMTKEIIKRMPQMKQGECVIFTGDTEHAQQTKSLPIRSFHPDRRDPGATVVGTSTDTADFVARMTGELAALVEEQKENDPKVLKARIRELQLNSGTPSEEVLRIDKAAEARGYASAMKAANQHVINALDGLRSSLVGRIEGAVRVAIDEVFKSVPLPHMVDGDPLLPGKQYDSKTDPYRPDARSLQMRHIVDALPVAKVRPFTDPDGTYSKGMQGRILNALAWLEAHGIEPATRAAVAAKAGAKAGGHFDSSLGALRTAGLVTYPSGGTVMLTVEGAKKAGKVDTSGSLYDSWLSIVNPLQRAMLEALHRQHPRPMIRGALAKAIGRNPGGHFDSTLGRLRTLGAVDYPEGGMVGLTKNVMP